MCVFKKEIKNPRYYKGDKDLSRFCYDKRKLKIPINCGKCTECRNRRATDWRQRLTEEKDNSSYTHMYFVTLTFSDESLLELANLNENLGIYSEGYALEKWIGKLAIKRFRERWRKRFKKSPRYWFITEKGANENFYERLQFHGFIWTDIPESIFETILNDRWQYGRATNDGEAKTGSVIYCTDYMSKFNKLHPNFTPLVRCSHGIGSGYINDVTMREHWRNGEFNNQYKFVRTGKKVILCDYYRKKLTTEKQRSQIWTKALDDNIKYLRGAKYNCNIYHQERAYEHHLKFVQDEEIKSGIIPHKKITKADKLKRSLERASLKMSEKDIKFWDNYNKRNFSKSTFNIEQWENQQLTQQERLQIRQSKHLEQCKSIAEKQMKKVILIE